MDKRAKAPVESMVIQDDISHQGTTLVVHAANSSLQEVALTKSKGQERICGSFTDELRITNERMFPSKCSAPTLGEHVPDVDQRCSISRMLALCNAFHVSVVQSATIASSFQTGDTSFDVETSIASSRKALESGTRHYFDADQDGFVLFDLAAVTGVHHASFPSIGKSLYPSPSGQVVEDTSHRQFAYLN